jgi:hypothetical protein
VQALQAGGVARDDRYGALGYAESLADEGDQPGVRGAIDGSGCQSCGEMLGRSGGERVATAARGYPDGDREAVIDRALG